MNDTARHRTGAGAGHTSSVLARVCTLALAAGLLVGCGDGGEGNDAAASPPPASAPETTSEDAGSGAATSDLADEGATSDDAADDSGDAADSGDEAAEEIVIVIQDFAYEVPDSVAPGAEIVVRNMDGVGHTVTSDEGEAFDVVVGPGEEVSFTAPSEAGDYPFHCTPHPAMTDTLVVEGDGS